MNFPELLRKTPYSELWYKPDTLFSMPKGYCIIDFICPQSGSSPESAVLTRIFVSLLKDYLNEYGKYQRLRYYVSLYVTFEKICKELQITNKHIQGLFDS